MHLLLEVKEDKNIGELGVFVKGKTSRPHFDGCFDSTSLAHDVLEHPYLMTGNPIEDELMALGGYYYIRVLGRYSNKYRYTTEEDLTDSVYSLLESCSYYFEDISISDPKQYRVNDSEYNDAINHAVIKGNRTYRKYNNEEDCYKFTTKEIKFIKGWICKGFSYTKNRYRGLDSCDLVYRFNTIERELENLFKSIGYEGQQFKVNINLRQNKVKWEQIYEPDYYDY